MTQLEAKGNPPNELFELHCRNLRKIHDAGMVIGMGTDGTGDGFGAHEQIEACTRCGMTAMEAIVAGTGTNARTPPGSDGDDRSQKRSRLRLLDADPLAASPIPAGISKVYLRGKELDRPALRARFVGR